MRNNRTGNIMAIIVIIAIVLTFSCMLLTSCGKDTNNQDDRIDRFYDLPMYAADSKNNESTYPLKIYVDKETRVQYITILIRAECVFLSMLKVSHCCMMANLINIWHKINKKSK